MGTAKPITAAGRARVDHALRRHGLLLVQGQWEIPSVADLLEGRPITTRGYSWDYVPAWRCADELSQRPDVAAAKLFRGRSTLILQRMWPAVDTLARAAASRVGSLETEDELRAFLMLVDAEPGIAGGEIRRRLGLDAKRFQRIKSRLEQHLCVFGLERDDLDHHTHESRWFPWTRSKVSRGVATTIGAKRAAAALLDGVYPDGPPERRPSMRTLFPAAGAEERSPR